MVSISHPFHSSFSLLASGKCVSVLILYFSFDFRVAEDVFEPGFGATKEKSHLFFTNKWRKDSSGRDSHM